MITSKPNGQSVLCHGRLSPLRTMLKAYNISQGRGNF